MLEWNWMVQMILFQFAIQGQPQLLSGIISSFRHQSRQKQRKYGTCEKGANQKLDFHRDSLWLHLFPGRRKWDGIVSWYIGLIGGLDKKKLRAKWQKRFPDIFS